MYFTIEIGNCLDSMNIRTSQISLNSKELQNLISFIFLHRRNFKPSCFNGSDISFPSSTLSLENQKECHKFSLKIAFLGMIAGIHWQYQIKSTGQLNNGFCLHQISPWRDIFNITTFIASWNMRVQIKGHSDFSPI